ncbi:hypothetical protein J5N97_025040 [Dioscorea zingiberensis]|uniref:Disease resistance R13L4/SHOC-2-like LRR domain-containing protein n=1 Tax=Dioscorea zingiberensis TaxID=325984 RepID=A0A9D5C890_9LILI|nr:hypothetical protein J5N97_025040 [Dioscorea zingiberensis]
MDLETSPIKEAVEEVMRIYKSLPPRPTIEDVKVAMAIIKTVDKEEELKISQNQSFPRISGLDDELFSVLQEARKCFISFHSYQQKKEAQLLLDLDTWFQAFDDIIRRTSELVSTSNGADHHLLLVSSSNSENSENSHVGTKTEKLSIIKVASLIESTAKDGTGVLDLGGKLMDQIEWLPTSLGKLEGITDLNLSENQITALPQTIDRLRFLQKLDIHSNQMTEIPETIGELSNLINLDVHANRLKSLPSSLGNLTNLTSLDLSSNQISELPDTLGNLTRLKRLILETNEIEEIPYTIGSCSSLIELRLDFNRLKALPEAIGKLEKLEVLTLHYNRIKRLPTTMASLSDLREFDVSFNELELVPETLCFATKLVRLNVGRNFADLQSLPRSIGNLEMLEELDISSNQIRILPDSFRFLSKLKVLQAEETPLEVPPRQVIESGPQAVIRFMNDLVAAKEVRRTQVAEENGFCLRICPKFHHRRKEINTGIVPTKA